jgi:predicted HD phosphohydrolase
MANPVGPDLPLEVAEQANLIYLVDRVDAMAAPYYQGGELLMHTAAIREQIEQRRGSHFAPQLVDAFLRPRRQRPSGCSWSHAALPAYCRTCASASALHCQHRPAQATGHAVFLHCRCQEPVHRTPFAGRGRPVALAGRTRRAAPGRCDQLEIAALLHDLGKLRVPDEILEKPADWMRTNAA